VKFGVKEGEERRGEGVRVARVNDTMQNGAATERGVQHPVAQPLSLTASSRVCAMHVIPAVYISLYSSRNGSNTKTQQYKHK